MSLGDVGDERVARLLEVVLPKVGKAQVQARQPPYFEAGLLLGQLSEPMLGLLVVLLAERRHRGVELMRGKGVAMPLPGEGAERHGGRDQYDHDRHDDLVQVFQDEIARVLEEALEFVGLLELFAA